MLRAWQLATLLGDIPLVVIHASGAIKVRPNDVYTGIAPILSAERIAAVVMMHACRSGKVGPNDLFTGIAPMLSAEGIAAVVAMQFTVSVEAANRFAVVVYRNLAKGESLQTAVMKARQALYAEQPQSWYVP